MDRHAQCVYRASRTSVSYMQDKHSTHRAVPRSNSTAILSREAQVCLNTEAHHLDLPDINFGICYSPTPHLVLVSAVSFVLGFVIIGQPASTFKAPGGRSLLGSGWSKTRFTVSVCSQEWGRGLGNPSRVAS